MPVTAAVSRQVFQRMASPKIFISYRRDDSAGHAGRLFDRLAGHFGPAQVFRDIDTLAAGEDFVQAVRERVQGCDVLLTLIGTRWLSAADEDGRWRLADENDLVRTEIAIALQRNLRVIPVLLQGAAMPKAKDLPAELGALARRNAVEIRDTSFDRDLAQLLQLLGPSWWRGLLRRLQRPAVYLPLAAAAAALGGLWAYPQIAMTPDKARIQIVQMGMAYDADTLVARARAGDLQAVTLFLRAGMAPDAPDSRAVTAAQWAAGNGHLPVLQALLDKGADGGKALVWAAGYGRHDIVNLLMQRQPSAEAIGLAMHNAAGTRHTDIVKTLLDAGADIETVGHDGKRTALIEAAQALNLGTVRLLLQRGANVNAQDANGYSALHAAADSRSASPDAAELALRTDVAQALLDQGADTTLRMHSMRTWQPTPLLLAIDDRLVPVALLLIERGADVNASTASRGGDLRQLSPLMLAARNGLPDVVEALLAKGAAVDWRNERGHTALTEMALGGDSHPSAGVAMALLAAGADSDAASNEQRTALMYAAGSRYQVDVEFVRLLLDHGAKLDAADHSGRTPLMFAAAAGQTAIARELMQRGANARATDAEGRTALAIATQAQHKEVVQLLSAAGAPPARPRP